jgi:two-component system LytT family response regulator
MTRAPLIRALVVDDEPLARETLQLHLSRQPDIVVVGEAADGFSAISQMESLRPDVVFLDVQMPDISGFDVLEALPADQLPFVVFVTAHDRFALQAFETHALDYLLKPFSAARFDHAIHRVRFEVAQTGDARTRQRLAALIEEHRRRLPELEQADATQGYLARLVVSHNRRIALVRTDDIDWIESSANYVRLHVGGTSRLLRMTMNQLERRLDPKQFARIHRSTIVRIDRIADMTALFHGDFKVTLKDGTELRLSRKFRSRLER